MAVLAAAVLLGLSAGAPASASARLTADEALALAFPGCSVARQTVYLTDDQTKRAADLAKLPVESALVYRYEVTCDGKPGGVGYFDTHRVRTQAETLLVALDPSGVVLRLEVVSFAEPPEYVPRAVWYEQFEGDRLTDDLTLGRGIRPVTGATLTARATTDATRRVLAIDAVLRADAAAAAGRAAAPPSGSSAP
jgi:hypothetical protein